MGDPELVGEWEEVPSVLRTDSYRVFLSLQGLTVDTSTPVQAGECDPRSQDSLRQSPSWDVEQQFWGQVSTWAPDTGDCL